MDKLEDQYEEGEIGQVALIVEIVSPQHGHQITAEFSDGRDHVNIGLLEVIRNSLLGRGTTS
jgi:hypothetical protein